MEKLKLPVETLQVETFEAGDGQEAEGTVHAHMTPAAWLKREHVRAACRLLLDTERRVVDVGHAAGFESESAFHRQFLAIADLPPVGDATAREIRWIRE